MEEILTIETVGPAGDGIAHRSDGAPVFIPLSAPGDKVRASIAKDHEDHWRGNMAELIERGADRADPPCRHYGRCGGCSLQHVGDSFYGSFKYDVVIQALERAGVDVDIVNRPIFVKPGTRRRAVFSFTKQGKKITIGFNARKSHEILEVPGCLILEPEIVTLVAKLKDYLPSIVQSKTGDVMIQHVEGLIEVSITAKLGDDLAFHEAIGAMIHELGIARINARNHDRQSYDLLLEGAPLIKSFGPLRVHLPPATFLQPSIEGEKILSDLVMEMSGVGTAMTDLFCGAGTFTGPLSTKAKVTAIDSSVEAIAALNRAAAGKPITVSIRNLFTDPLTTKELNAFDVVVLDPPRAGAKEQAQMLADSDVRRIVYVSCNAQSFARDAKILQDGGYSVKRVQPVDQFTWSVHGETVSLIERD
jgi:23S rRNA (uracil1939-C5)-methyltransferase